MDKTYVNLRILKPWHTDKEEFHVGKTYQFSDMVADILLRHNWAVHADVNDGPPVKAKAPELVKVIGEQGGLF